MANQRYDAKLCEQYLANRDLDRLWLHLKNEGDLLVPDSIKRLSIFLKMAKNWLDNPRPTGAFHALYLSRLQREARKGGLNRAGLSSDNCRQSSVRVNQLRWNPDENSRPQTMQEQLLVSFGC